MRERIHGRNNHFNSKEGVTREGDRQKEQGFRWEGGGWPAQREEEENFQCLEGVTHLH